MGTDAHDAELKAFSLALVAICVRNGHLENLHAGKGPSSKTGDYSDVKVVTPYGEIPWNEVSRFNDEEMKILIKDIVNSVYTLFANQDNDAFMRDFMKLGLQYAARWDAPEINPRIMESSQRTR